MPCMKFGLKSWFSINYGSTGYESVSMNSLIATYACSKVKNNTFMSLCDNFMKVMKIHMIVHGYIVSSLVLHTYLATCI